MNLIEMILRYVSQTPFVEMLVEYRWWIWAVLVVLAVTAKLVFAVEDVFVGARYVGFAFFALFASDALAGRVPGIDLSSILPSFSLFLLLTSIIYAVLAYLGPLVYAVAAYEDEYYRL